MHHFSEQKKDALFVASVVLNRISPRLFNQVYIINNNPIFLEYFTQLFAYYPVFNLFFY